MTITTNCTDRKKMVAQISQRMGVRSEYLRAPTYAYSIGAIIVHHDASITASAEDLEAIRALLIENGYIDETPGFTEEREPTEGETDTADESTVENQDSEAEQPADEEAQQSDRDEEPEAAGHVTRMCISIPLAEFTSPALINVLKMVYARQALISAMTRSDLIYIHEELMDLIADEKPESVERICEMLSGECETGMVRGVEVQEERLMLMFPFDEAQPTLWVAYGDLLTAIVDRAKQAHHTSGKRLDPQEEEMKYFCRNWLIQLGLGGPSHKETQHILLGHLKGFAAFRSAAKMDAHKAKYAALRRERREETQHEAD